LDVLAGHCAGHADFVGGCGKRAPPHERDKDLHAGKAVEHGASVIYVFRGNNAFLCRALVTGRSRPILCGIAAITAHIELA